MTLKTEVEAGASGYSVTGGGDQGIFVKQVLKDSSAAKLFSLREGVCHQPGSTSLAWGGQGQELGRPQVSTELLWLSCPRLGPLVPLT